MKAASYFSPARSSRLYKYFVFDGPPPGWYLCKQMSHPCQAEKPFAMPVAGIVVRIIGVTTTTIVKGSG